MVSEPLKGFASYNSLLSIWRKGIRNRNWTKLSRLEKGLFRCALSLAKIRDRISNLHLLLELAKIASKLLRTPKSNILQAGLAKAQALSRLYALNGVFNWAPELRDWLQEPTCIFRLGLEAVD